MIHHIRSSVNTIIPDRVFQRGQIYTWQREVKVRQFRDWGVTAVVNFWPKVDPDLGDIGLDWYWQISCPRSEGMLDDRVQVAATSVISYLKGVRGSRVLVLCEAGKTRSVFFCVLLVAGLNKMSYVDALRYVEERVPGIALKRFMLDWVADR